MIRTVLDNDGNIIATIELPDGTSEEIWQEKLNKYKVSEIILPISARQIRLALLENNISMQDMDLALDNLPEPTRSKAKIAWEYSLEFIRNDETVSKVGELLGYTSQDLDDLWKLGATL